MAEQSLVEKIKGMIGKELGVSHWVQVDQARINKFAEATEDYQWIHVDVEKAKKGPFGKTIAHGYLTLSLISGMSYAVRFPFDMSGMKMVINYGLNKVRFLNPVLVDSKIRTKVSLLSAEEKGPGRVLLSYKHEIEVEGKDKPAAVAETLAMMFL
jgi:acyl dehydratase